MKNLYDLMQAIEASIRSIDYTLGIAKEVYPPVHRIDMIRSQVEVARDVLEKAKGFGSASSGFFKAVDPTEPPPPDDGKKA
jgi:hypothetical protein